MYVLLHCLVLYPKSLPFHSAESDRVVLFDTHLNVLAVEALQGHFRGGDHPRPVRCPDSDEVVSGVQPTFATTPQQQLVHCHLRNHRFHCFLVVGQKHPCKLPFRQTVTPSHRVSRNHIAGLTARRRHHTLFPCVFSWLVLTILVRVRVGWDCCFVLRALRLLVWW